MIAIDYWITYSSSMSSMINSKAIEENDVLATISLRAHKIIVFQTNTISRFALVILRIPGTTIGKVICVANTEEMEKMLGLLHA